MSAMMEHMVVFAGDTNGHIFGYGSRNADGSRILEFPDGLNLVIRNTLFTKQEAKLVTYVAGPVKSTVDYIMAVGQSQGSKRKLQGMLIPGKSYSWVESRNSRVSIPIETLDFARVCNFYRTW